jgi:hypothetical protein
MELHRDVADAEVEGNLLFTEAFARRQIELIDWDVSFRPDVRCLSMLLVVVAADAGWHPLVSSL